MGRTPPAQVLATGCPPPLVEIEGHQVARPLDPTESQEICISQIRAALRDIAAWVEAVDKSLACFPQDLCVECGGTESMGTLDLDDVTEDADSGSGGSTKGTRSG